MVCICNWIDLRLSFCRRMFDLCLVIMQGIVNTAKREDMNHILQQILDLKRLQLNQGTGTSYLTDQEEIDVSSFRFSTMWKQQDNLDQHLQHSLDLGSNLESLGSAPEKSAAESFPSLFSHLDGDAFWQCKSPAQNGQVLL